MQDALARCGLATLVPRLHAAEMRWDRVLSAGEQQRLGFARLLLHRPRCVLLDEATSALDEANQAAMMALFDTAPELAGCTLLSVGHRPGLEAWHDRVLVLERRGAGGAVLRPVGASPMPSPARPARRARTLMQASGPESVHRSTSVAGS